MNTFQEINRKRANLFWHIVDIYSGLISMFGILYEKNVGKEYQKEIECFKISKSKKILHIGCGAYPISAIILGKIYSSKIVAIDKNQFAVNLAQKVVQKKNLSDKIKVLKANGADFDVNGFDTIIISSCSIPKNVILNNVFRNAKSKCKIIIRELPVEEHDFKPFLQTYKKIQKNGEIDCQVFPGLKWNSFCFIKNN
jgi:ubiquinone/menaquinone biosynthesis C-methylase UbiE